MMRLPWVPTSDSARFGGGTAELAASKPPDGLCAGLETRTTAAEESGATRTQFTDKLKSRALTLLATAKESFGSL
jgi:hypothetical protein